MHPLLNRVLFDGPIGWLAAAQMARGNAAAEAEAVETLAPGHGDAVLAVGFGPGVGIGRALERVPDGWVAGADPSLAMCRLAARRHRDEVLAGRVRLVRTTADALPWPDATFDGAMAVHSIQLWEPRAASLAEVARVLRPGARLVTLTHAFAVRAVARVPVEVWVEELTSGVRAAGFDAVAHGRGRADGGRVVAVSGRRAG